jgi:anti-sigma factor RsiW
MTEHRIDELLDAKRDGTLEAAAALELERELQQNPAARRRAEEIDALSQILDIVGDEPPAAIVSDVMEKIAALPVRRPAARIIQLFPRSTSGGGMVMAKKVMFGVAAAAAIVLISVAITGFPHVNSSGTLGAIGAAKRAQAPQITASDVKTGDPAVQQFLQSDTFDRLMKDPSTKKLLSDPGFRMALSSADILSALASGDLKAALA